MTPLFPAQRAAEEFDQVLAGTADTGRGRALRRAPRRRRAAAHALPEVTPRAEFVGDLRSRLMTAAETELVAAPPVVPLAAPGAHPPPQPPSRHHRRLASSSSAAPPAWPPPPPARCPARRSTRSSAASSRSRPPPTSATPARARPCSARPRPGSTRSAPCRPRARPTPTWSPRPSTPSARAADSGSDEAVQRLPGRRRQGDISTVRDFTAVADGRHRRPVRRRRHRHQRPARRRRRHPRRHRPAGRDLCGPCGPGKPLAPPKALSSRRRCSHGGQPDRPTRHPGAGRHQGRPPLLAPPRSSS